MSEREVLALWNVLAVVPGMRGGSFARGLTTLGGTWPGVRIPDRWPAYVFVAMQARREVEGDHVRSRVDLACLVPLGQWGSSMGKRPRSGSWWSSVERDTASI